MKNCQISDCSKKRIARGWCHMHYKRWQLHGSPEIIIVPQEYHGMVSTPEYRTWVHLKGRCNNPTDSRYADYGGRGIKVCTRWNNSFAAFYADMGKRPKGKTLDRINNDKGYSPKNCRWATKIEQARNKKNNRVLCHDGESLCVSAWADRTGLSSYVILMRLKRGWGVDRTLTTLRDARAGRTITLKTYRRTTT